MPVYRFWRCSVCDTFLTAGVVCYAHPQARHNAATDLRPEELATVRIYVEAMNRAAKKRVAAETAQRELEQNQRNDYLEALTKQLKGRP